MRQSIPFAGCLLLAACGPNSTFHDYTSPERAARSFLEAGRIGDSRSVRESVVAAERDSVGYVDYASIGDYTLTLDALSDAQRAVVLLRTGQVTAPLACIKEGASWKVSITATLRCMQQMARDPLASAPR